ncbi:MAG: helix-turn-helix domain-containing protein [Clostridiales bacterium]|nr:helix-turn-helix domain-containing protein [Clostridiales bacterium]
MAIYFCAGICYNLAMFGDNLKKYRIQNGYSQSELADLLFVSRQCISKWEKGITQPDLQALAQISELFNVPIDILVKEGSAPTVAKKASLNKYLFIANILISLFCVLSFVALWRFLPEIIPAHWTRGVVDRYGSHAEVFLNIITAAVFLIADIAMVFVIRRVTDKRAAAIVHVVLIAAQFANLIFIFAMYAKLITALASFCTCIAAIIMLCISIAMHPRISKQNSLLGVRTSATLSSEKVWNNTNALACYMFAGLSVAILIINMVVIFDMAYLCITAYIIPAIACVVYSYKI